MTDQDRSVTSWIVVVLLLLIAICCFFVKPGRGTDTVVHFVCPGDPVVIDLVDRATGAVLSSTTGVPASEPITNIPEFHDCQRFQKAGTYDSLYAIFASFQLDSLSTKFSLDSGLAATEGRPNGIVPAATIYSHGGTYHELGIEPGFNCLFFYRTGTTNRKWAAKMVPWGGSADPDCFDHRRDPYTTGTDLEVKTDPNTGFGMQDNAPVARWDWDAQNQRHYIGIACDKEWCQVGKEGFQPSAPYSVPDLRWGPLNGTTPTLASVTYNRVFKVRGWYDVQRLEVVTGNVMQPGPAHGFLIPHPELEKTNDGPGLSAYLNKWNHVANAVVDADYLKWNFKAGQNEIWFCYGNSDSCKISNALLRVSGSSTPLLECARDPRYPTQRWWARIVSATSDTAYACVERKDHSAELTAYRIRHPDMAEVRMVGAARWRYLPTDAGEWISCPAGCCTIR
jgi:hypothetical protein